MPLAAVLLVAVVASLVQPIHIDTAHESEAERKTAEQLRSLLRRYDVSPWLFTKKVRIDEREIPHSHPVLTIHTRHLGQDTLLLSTFLHEQLHWFLDSKPVATREAVAELEKLIPEVPVGFPEGASSRQSTYEHLLLTYLERAALVRVVGEAEASGAIQFWITDHYRWIYRTMLDRSDEIESIVRRHELQP
jgi:hypothetical protein